MKYLNWKTLLAIAVILGIIFIAVLPLVSKTPQVKYKTEYTKNNFQIRFYEPLIIASVNITGFRKEALEKGFTILADYIYGNNQVKATIPLHNAINQRKSTKIEMTAPVLQQQTDSQEEWTIEFVMPATYTLETLPRPNDKQIQIQQIPARRVAVITFSGTPSDENINHAQEQLMKFIKDKNLQPTSEPIFAFYNPPWTLLALRRNEVVVDVR